MTRTLRPIEPIYAKDSNQRIQHHLLQAPFFLKNHFKLFKNIHSITNHEIRPEESYLPTENFGTIAFLMAPTPRFCIRKRRWHHA